MLMDFQEDSKTSNKLYWIALSKQLWSSCFVPFFVSPDQRVLKKKSKQILKKVKNMETMFA